MTFLFYLIFSSLIFFLFFLFSPPQPTSFSGECLPLFITIELCHHKYIKYEIIFMRKKFMSVFGVRKSSYFISFSVGYLLYLVIMSYLTSVLG